MIELNPNQPRELHRLKCWPEFFNEIFSGRKTFEARKNDRNYQVDDFLELREWDPKTENYSGRAIYCGVTYILHGGKMGIEPGWCVMGIRNV